MPLPCRNHRAPTACDAPTTRAASSSSNPFALAAQKSRSTSRRCDGAPGDFIGDRPGAPSSIPLACPSTPPCSRCCDDQLNPPLQLSECRSRGASRRSPASAGAPAPPPHSSHAVGRRRRPRPGEPLADRLRGADAEQLRHPGHRRPLGRLIGSISATSAPPLPQLRRIPPVRISWHDSAAGDGTTHVASRRR
jgi:hypothetical protein